MLLSFKQKPKIFEKFFEKKHAFFIWEFVQDHQKHDFEKVFLLVLNDLEGCYCKKQSAGPTTAQDHHTPGRLL